MRRSHIELENTAENLIASLGIKRGFKPDVKRMAVSLGLKISQDLKPSNMTLSALLLNGDDADYLAGRQDNVIVVNMSRDEKDVRFAIAYQIANYVLFADERARYYNQLTSLQVSSPDDDGIRLANAILLNETLFIENFKKALKGVPNDFAVRRNLSDKFQVPLYSVEQRVGELELEYKFKPTKGKRK